MAYEDGEASKWTARNNRLADARPAGPVFLVGFGVGVAATSFACSEW